MRIVWDEPKRVANIQKHGLDFRDLSLDFFIEATILPATGRRSKAVNLLDGRPVTAVFAPLGSEAVSVVSLRPAARNERSSVR